MMGEQQEQPLEWSIDYLKPLNLDQYDTCKARALKRVHDRIGEKPRRNDFKREHGSNWTVLDWLAVLIFLGALGVSSVHIITHMGLASAAADALLLDDIAGMEINIFQKAVVHQIAYIMMAEAAMLLFLTMWAINSGKERGWRRFLSVPLFLAILAATFVIVANWQSGIGLLESIMPPLFTIGIGFHLEALIVRQLQRRAEVDQRYAEAMDIYERAQEDPTKHPDYQPILRQEIWQKLASLKQNRPYADAPAGFKHAAVAREQARDSWAYDQAAMAQQRQFATPLPSDGRLVQVDSNSNNHSNGAADDEDLASLMVDPQYSGTNNGSSGY